MNKEREARRIIAAGVITVATTYSGLREIKILPLPSPAIAAPVKTTQPLITEIASTKTLPMETVAPVSTGALVRVPNLTPESMKEADTIIIEPGMLMEEKKLQREVANNIEKKKIVERAEYLRKEQIIPPIYWGNRHNQEVALTFDDGYSSESIKRVLSVLKEEHIQATFFVIGEQLRAHPKLWAQAIRDGHHICNHTHTHTYLATLDDKGIMREINQWEADVVAVLGKQYLRKMKEDFPYMRFPGGSGYRSRRVLKVVEANGYVPVAWSQDTYYDVLKKHNLKKDDPGEVAGEVEVYTVRLARSGSIILLHFNIWDTLDLKQIINGIREKQLKIGNINSVLADGE